VRNVSSAGYAPVVAHAERYRCLSKGKRGEELIDLEALMQMNYRSVSGDWKDWTARWCKDNLKKRIIHFM
ncbi:CpsB/CapC family capsule biosynthesis tyrosine phosphatase, partial [Mediterraneibacter faecis]|uniref:CpsB/CapC family capsule biosynthesis tyrosine phosphatase n=1 Tax=Mediterraneibacter faecis TaxID=592978 RepID=UPI0027415786